MAGEGVQFSDVLSTNDAFGGAGKSESSLWQRKINIIIDGEDFCLDDEIPETG